MDLFGSIVIKWLSRFIVTKTKPSFLFIVLFVQFVDIILHDYKVTISNNPGFKFQRLESDVYYSYSNDFEIAKFYSRKAI